MVATTTPHSWPIKRLFELKEGGTSGRLLIPIFQRGLVWDERRRKELIASIQLGHPIGSILIWERTLDNEKQYHLIDGLQRTNSIFTYLESPLVDFDPEWLDGPELENFVRAITTDGTDPDQIFKNQVIAQFKSWLIETKATSYGATFNGYNLAKSIGDNLGISDMVLSKMDEIMPIAGNLCDAIVKKSDIQNYEIPIIVYEGPEESLPDIFKKINSNGVALTKYDKFAASWQTFATRVSDVGIRQSIRAKYAQLLDRGFEFYNYDPDDSDRYNLFEYLFGLGKHLSDQYPELINSSNQPFDVESLSFSVATIAHGLRLSDMANLPPKFDTTNDIVDPTVFQIALSDAFDKFEQIVKPIYDLRLNARAGGRINISIPEYQLASFVARLLVGKYSSPGFAQKDGWEVEWNSELPKGIRHYYLSDMIQQYWRGSGDSKLYARVWNEDDPDHTPNEAYNNPLGREYWDSVLALWFDESLQSNQRDRAPVRWVDRMVMRFIYMNIVSVLDNADVE